MPDLQETLREAFRLALQSASMHGSAKSKDLPEAISWPSIHDLALFGVTA